VKLGTDWAGMGALEIDTGAKEDVSEHVEEGDSEEKEETNKKELKDSKKKSSEPNMFQRVKRRLSFKEKKQKENVQYEKENDEQKEEKPFTENGSGEQPTPEHETKVNTKDEKIVIVTDTKMKEEIKEENEKENIVEDEKKKKEKGNDKNSNVFVRVKERLSTRSKKKQKKDKIIEDGTNETSVKENDIPKDEELNTENESDTTNNVLQDKEEETKPNKEENIFQKLLRRFSFRSKKKKEEFIAVKEDNSEHENEDISKVDSNKDDTKSLSSVDEELSALCKENTEEPQETTPSVPAISSSRPPLPTTRRPPSSATTAQSRPVSQLDAALKQFRLSTAASRENLRSSRVDISQVEEQVKTMVTSRPSTPTPAGWRSRAPAENKNLADQWAKLSSSMTDLR